MAVKFQTRRGTAAAWTAANSILAEGEVGLELDTGYEKVGDGVTAWNALGYHVGIAPVTHAATSKATPIDADEVPLVDSAASNGLKKLTWANLKATFWTAVGALIAATTSKATPVDADGLVIADSAASNGTKQLTWANVKATLKTYFDTLYSQLGYIGAMTFASLPAASGANGKWALVTDVGTSPGVFMVCNGTRWKTLDGTAVLKGLGAPVSGINNVETNVVQALLPAGLLQANDTLRIRFTGTKSGTTDSGRITVRIGTAGTTADAALNGLAAFLYMSTANVSGGWEYDVKLISTTSAQKVGNNTAGVSAYGSGSSSAAATATAIPDVSVNPLYVSIAFQSNSTTDTLGITSCQLHLVTP